MLIGQHILVDRAMPYLSALPCDALYFVIDSAVEMAMPQEFLAFVQRHHCLRLHIQSENKDTAQLAEIWAWLREGRASRESILVIIGGGTLTDLAGFAAATYMRGIRTVNITSSLLGMVDASVGGKTGIDFAGVKNLIGAFHPPIEVIIDTCFLATLPLEELYSGYGEIIKTALLSGEDLWRRVLSLGEPQYLTDAEYEELIIACINYKSHIVAQDPEERTGLRAVLNLGHTTAHAIEAHSRQRGDKAPIKHGEAVVVGLIVEAYLAHKHLGLNKSIIRQLMSFAGELYPRYPYACKEYDAIIELMCSDKKNSDGFISFSLLQGLGSAQVWKTSDREGIKEALDFYRETFGR